MSGTIGQTEYGLLNQLLANSATVRQRLNRLTQQVGSGSIADTYAGLGAGASVSLNLRPQIAALQTQQKNIDAATARLGVTQTSMTQLQNIASGLLANLNNLNGLNPGELDSIAANARAALAQTASLLNARWQRLCFRGGGHAEPADPQSRCDRFVPLCRPDCHRRRRPVR